MGNMPFYQDALKYILLDLILLRTFSSILMRDPGL